MVSRVCPCCNQMIFHAQAKERKEEFDKIYIQDNRERFGTFKGHSSWDLAVSWFQTDNDTFFKVYGFNFVPKGKLFKLAQAYVFYSKSVESPLQSSLPNSIDNSVTLGNSINIAANSLDGREKVAKNISEQISRMLGNSIGGNRL